MFFLISDELISEVQDEGRRIRRRRKLCPTSPSHQPTDAAMQALPSSNSWSSPLTAGSFSRDLLQVQCSGGFSPPRSVSPGSLSPTRSREPTFTVKQVVSLCERLWKEREEKLREEYNQVLSDRLAGTYSVNSHSSWLILFGIIHINWSCVGSKGLSRLIFKWLIF